MKIYFVRHGESALTDKRHQLPDTPLSDLGIQQAESVANRLARIPADLILSSPYLRAVQTAQEIKKIKNAPLIQNDLLIERKMPSSFLGKKVDDGEISTIHETIRSHFYETTWHYADEENFADLVQRASSVLKLITSYQKENVVVVTHGYFLTVLIFYILFSDNIVPQSFASFREHIEFSLAGMSLIEYKNDKWKVLMLNDSAHL